MIGKTCKEFYYFLRREITTYKIKINNNYEYCNASRPKKSIIQVSKISPHY